MIPQEVGVTKLEGDSLTPGVCPVQLATYIHGSTNEYRKAKKNTCHL
jgi:hypothetical protein